MIVVSDTSPISYLILIGHVDVLYKLFGRVLVTRSVLSELLHQEAPPPVRGWAAQPPSWIAVHEDPIRESINMPRLQIGEQSAILLAEALKADVVLLDDKSARVAAANRGLRVAGTLGVLAEAATIRLIDFTVALERLSRTNFRSSPGLLKAVMDRLAQKSI